ncbi:MAG: response regulator [Limisphaerales bacterium]
MNFLVANATGRNHSSSGALPGWENSTGEDKILRKRILLVDDERFVRESIARLLSKDEHNVVEANNGAEAFALFTRGQFDLVMTDFEIPFMRGNELAARIKQLAPRQPVLMITGYGKRPGPDNPVDAVLNKPFDFDQLRRAMAKVLSEVGASLTA